MRKLSLMMLVLLSVVTLLFWATGAWAYSNYYTDPARGNCQSCHGTTNTCAGCHAHGVHSSNAKNDINLTGATNKTTYSPGEQVSVTINGGYRSGWVRAVLYDQNGVEVARSSGTSFPVVLSAPAPSTGGTYTWSAAWYGNRYDAGSAIFGPRWTPDARNPNHGQEIISTNSFTVVSAAAPDVNLNPASVDFGTVTTGSSVTVSAEIQNLGTADLNVTGITRCVGTSPEFTWSPALPFTVAAGGSQTL
ncbi:MAG: choice-of-anchor D domain-containing protein, partial [bacterium]